MPNPRRIVGCFFHARAVAPRGTDRAVALVWRKRQRRLRFPIQPLLVPSEVFYLTVPAKRAAQSLSDGWMLRTFAEWAALCGERRERARLAVRVLAFLRRLSCCFQFR